MKGIHRPFLQFTLTAFLILAACTPKNEQPANILVPTSASTTLSGLTETMASIPASTLAGTPSATSFEPGVCKELGFTDAMYQQYTCYLIDSGQDYKINGAISNNDSTFMVFYPPDILDPSWQRVKEFLRFAVGTKGEDLSDLESVFEAYESGKYSLEPNASADYLYGKLYVSLAHMLSGEKNVMWLAMRYVP